MEFLDKTKKYQRIFFGVFCVVYHVHRIFFFYFIVFKTATIIEGSKSYEKKQNLV